jgi:uncharacterized cofD-like protein
MKRKKIVTIGGGTGSFTLLTGLKKYPVDISAIVSMADDGGSAGVLRDELGVLPPGDVRQCLIALSDSSDMLRQLMSYRFDKGGLKGHAFGNLFLSALEKINGSFSKGVEEATQILDVQGEVVPISEKSMTLKIKLNNGKTLIGEKQLDHSEEIRKIGIRSISLKAHVPAYKKALDRIKEADLINIGPGDLYGSIVPVLLVDGVCEAVRKSKAKVVFNCNLTNKMGQTENFKVDQYVSVIEKYLGAGRIDFVTVNNNGIPPSLVKKYEKREGKGSVIKFEKDTEKKFSYRVLMADLFNNEKLSGNKNDLDAGLRSFIRHDSDKLAKVVMLILELGDYESIIKKII